jgi:hypothetical protein
MPAWWEGAVAMTSQIAATSRFAEHDRVSWLTCGTRLAVIASMVIVASDLTGDTSELMSTTNVSSTATEGALSLGTDRGGRAILAADDLAPGVRVEGRITLENTGPDNGLATLTTSRLDDTVDGAGGAKLSDVLDLTILDGAAEIYRGPIDELTTVDLGRWDAGEAHTYEFVVTMPDWAGNQYQGTAMTTDFTWTVTSP